MTPTMVGWVLADARDADGATLAGAEFTVQPRRDGVGAVNASAQAAAAVLRVHTLVEAQGERLRGIGVTWSADAAAQSALLLESLTGAGFDNVVPVRFHQAAESLTEGATEADAQLALARGAALALEPGLELSGVFTDPQPDDRPLPARTRGRERSRMQSYTGALAMLVTGAVTFIVSLSITLSSQLTPAKEVRPAHQVANAPEKTLPIAQPVPVAAPPPAGRPETPAEAPAAPDSPSEAAPTDEATIDAGAAAPQEEAAGLLPVPGHSLLSRVGNYLPGTEG
jgi:hypothetical protein